jgi:hypothetical protein
VPGLLLVARFGDCHQSGPAAAGAAVARLLEPRAVSVALRVANSPQIEGGARVPQARSGVVLLLAQEVGRSALVGRSICVRRLAHARDLAPRWGRKGHGTAPRRDPTFGGGREGGLVPAQPPRTFLILDHQAAGGLRSSFVGSDWPGVARLSATGLSGPKRWERWEFLDSGHASASRGVCSSLRCCEREPGLRNPRQVRRRADQGHDA